MFPRLWQVQEQEEKGGLLTIEALAAAIPLISPPAGLLPPSPPAYTAVDVQLPLDKPDHEAEDEQDGWEPCLQPAEEPPPAWSDLSCGKRVRQVLLVWIGKPLALLTLLYFFICSLDFLSSSFKLLGGKAAGSALSDNELLQNPIAGLMIGILATVLVQSSSTSTSIIVTMVASGILRVSPAVPIIMGANIGTSVTNTIVSLAQSSDRNEFRRAFAGATVHDMFNWLSVMLLLPLEAATGYLEHLTGFMVRSINVDKSQGAKMDMLKALTKPFTSLIIQLDKKIIEKIATGHSEYAEKSLIKEWCKYREEIIPKNTTSLQNLTVPGEGSEFSMENITELVNETVKIPVEECRFLFRSTGLSDTIVGLILLLLSLVMLCTCLVLMVKLLHSLLKGRIATVIKKTLNANLPGRLSFLTGYIALFIGAGMTILVQSSSVFTSAMTPLVGIGIIKIERMYPLTLGSNIGTTATSLLAAMAASGDRLQAALQISLCHLFFNISGIILFYPIPFMRLPIKMAKMMGNTTARYRWFAWFYLMVMFLVMPGLVFALSMLGTLFLTITISILLTVFFVVVVINIIQEKRPTALPGKLRNWEFLPEWMHSLDPLDKLITKLLKIFKLCCPFKCCQQQKQPGISIVAQNQELQNYTTAENAMNLNNSTIHSMETVYTHSASNAELPLPVSTV